MTSWRTRARTWTYHRNPLFDLLLGITFMSVRSYVLRTLNVGIYQMLVAKSWSVLILLNNACGVQQAAGDIRNEEDPIANGVKVLGQ